MQGISKGDLVWVPEECLYGVVEGMLNEYEYMVRLLNKDGVTCKHMDYERDRFLAITLVILEDDSMIISGGRKMISVGAREQVRVMSVAKDGM